MRVPQPMHASGGLRQDYVDCSVLAREERAGALGSVSFGSTAPVLPREAAALPRVHVPLPVLAGASATCEVWRAAGPAETRTHGAVHLRCTDDLLFGCVSLEEAPGSEGAAEDGAGGDPALRATTADAYRQMCATLDHAGYPHLLRVWNYLADINGVRSGRERYRDFNTARQQALRASGRPLRGDVPAASALGAPAGAPLVVYFLAGRRPPRFIENPRQVSAYHYPPEYGAHRPAFSRATLLEEPDGRTLFISGTASIVGHRSRHVGDTAAQTRETLGNLAALVESANHAAPGARFTLRDLKLKVYVRRPQDLSTVRHELDGAIGAGAAHALYLQADVCREELMVEMEAVGWCPAQGTPAAATRRASP